jgi:hypothetical protein
LQQVNQLLEARKQMAKLMKQMQGGKLPSLPGLQAPVENGARSPTARKTKSKRKKKKARR